MAPDKDLLETMHEHTANMEWWLGALTILGFLLTWVHQYSKAKAERIRFETRLEEQAKHLDSRINEIRADQTRALTSIRTDMNDTFAKMAKTIDGVKEAMLDADGDVKYLTSKRHAIICQSHQDMAEVHFSGIRKELVAIREAQAKSEKHYNDMQDKVLKALTSYAKQNGHAN
jgi:hypothetical protein